MPELYLHLGTHKTGTTSVQRFFSRNRAKLRERGIWYPSPAVAGLPDHYAHHRISHAIAGQDQELTTEDAVAFFDTVRAKARDGERIFISAEPLFRHQVADVPREERFARYAERVRDVVGDFDVTLVVMVRRQDLFAESLYAETVMSTGYTATIDKFLGQRAGLFDYRERMNVWTSAFPDARVWLDVFEPKTFEAPIERTFVERLGATWDDTFDEEAPRNISLPRVFVEFKRQMNVSDQGSGVSNTYRKWVEELAAAPAAESLPDLGRYYLDPATRLQLLDDHAEGNRELARRYLSRDELFTEAPLEDLRRYGDRRGLAPAEYRRISKLLFRMLASR